MTVRVTTTTVNGCLVSAAVTASLPNVTWTVLLRHAAPEVHDVPLVVLAATRRDAQEDVS